MTEFKEAVYAVVSRIPAGKVATYGDIAAILGERKKARAVGSALHVNPHAPQVPCHRVVNASGALAENFGAEGGAETQATRLQAEGVRVENGHVDLNLYRWQPEAEQADDKAEAQAPAAEESKAAKEEGKALQTLIERLKGYLNMEGEISFAEYASYAQEVFAYLQENYQPMEKEELLNAQYICFILYSNAAERMSRKDANRKKYKKLGDKANFWREAIVVRLQKAGMSQQEMQVWQSSNWGE